MEKLQRFSRICFLLASSSCLWSCVLIKATSKFVNAPSSGLDLLDTDQSSESALECARTCDRIKDQTTSSCKAFEFTSHSKTCKLYKNGSDTPSNQVYIKLLPGCDTRDGFQAVQKEGDLFCYLMTEDSKDVNSSTQICTDLGGYLLHLDSVTELFAAQDFVNMINSTYTLVWAGANDEANEGQWVTSKDGAPIDTDIWRWGIHEPNGNLGENCAMFFSQQRQILDNACDKVHHYICERDLTSLTYN